MYDPFATPPPPGTAQATGVPQQNQVMPNPAPIAPNNALASLYNKHMRNLAGPNGMFPGNPGGQMNPGWRQNYQQARMDWLGNRPDLPTFEGAQPDGWRAQLGTFKAGLRDWRDLEPRRHDYRMGTTTPPVA